MKNIEGFVGVVYLNGRHKLIGKSFIPGFLSEPFNIQLKPFKDIEVAVLGARQYSKMLNTRRFSINKLSMLIAEEDAERCLLQKSSGLVVVTYPRVNFPFYTFYGEEFSSKIKPNNQKVFLGTDIELNGLTPFDNYQNAEICAREISSVYQSVVSLAGFKLQKLRI